MIHYHDVWPDAPNPLLPNEVLISYWKSFFERYGWMQWKNRRRFLRLDVLHERSYLQKLDRELSADQLPLDVIQRNTAWKRIKVNGRWRFWPRANRKSLRYPNRPLRPLYG